MPSADLPLPWVQKIFQKLNLVYGRDFLSRWEGQELGAVMGDWAHELRGFADKPQAIAYALQHLPEKPPTVLQFRAICNASPADDGVLKLTANAYVPTPEQVQRLRDAAKALTAKWTTPE